MVNDLLVESCHAACHGSQDFRKVVHLSLRSARSAYLIILSVALAGCATVPPKPIDRPPPSITVEPPLRSDAWTRIATIADRNRIGRTGLAWQSALSDARRAYASEIKKEGELLDPRAALPRPAPTPGSYNCRMIKLGRLTSKTPAFESFKPFFCYVQVEDDLLTIVKQTGSQRPAGRLWEDDRSDRLVFLGSLGLGDEQQPRGYGEDPKRDMAGVLERIGPFKWRLVIPWPQGPSKLDVFELTPVADQPE
jgi:hypothetical protein